MLKRFLPKEEKFFRLFDEISVYMVEAVQALMECLRNPSLIEEELYIRTIEAKADAVTHTTLERLHDTFITPFDRNDIYELIQGLDDVIDLIHAAAERLIIYNLVKIPEITLRLAEKSQEAVLQVQKATSGLHNIKKHDALRSTCEEIHRLENESDVIFRENICKTLSRGKRYEDLISLKDINEILETVADRCEDLASLIESIILEYA